jgi:hypothetical protein
MAGTLIIDQRLGKKMAGTLIIDQRLEKKWLAL